MNNATFWGAAPSAGKKQMTGKTKFTMSNSGKKILGSIGITGVVLLAIASVLGVIVYVKVVKPLNFLMQKSNVLKEDGANIGEALRTRNLVLLDKVLTKTETDLKNIKTERDEKIGWLKDVKYFKANEFYADSDRFIQAGLYGVDALREASNVVKPFADAAGLKITEEQEIPQTEGLMEAFKSWVNIMPQVAAQMDPVIAKVDKVGEVLEPINVEKYPTDFQGLDLRDYIRFIKDNLSKASEYGPDIKNALILFPRLLAVDSGAKRYMIIMQNDKELRPTGGFMTNYATFKVADGLLDSDFTSKDMYSIDLTLDLIDATYDFPDPPAPYGKYLKVERWYARDMNFSPDFPTSMDQYLKFYNMAGRLNPLEIKPVDGVIAIDTNVIKELLDTTGPVTVNGITYTSENVVLELEKIASLELREQANRKKVLGQLMNAMLKNIFESTDKNLWPKLIDKGVSLAVRKHIQAYVFDPESQVLIDKYGLGGRILDNVAGDYTTVISTNLGGDKTNWFVKKNVDHTLEKSGDKWLRTVKITYSYPEPSAEYGPFVKGFKDWVRVYIPLGSEFVGFDGSEDGILEGEERGKKWYSAYVELAPNESQEIVFKYYLPANAIVNGKYNLTIQKQAGIDAELHKVNVNGKVKEVELTKDVMLSFPLQ
jgi:hypothetical protein